MLAECFLWLTNHSARGRRMAFRWLFERIARRFGDAERWTFMNYGYADLDGESLPMPLDEADEPERYCLQLYHHVASAVDLRGKDVLEVSCGRGGGASYVRRYFRPRSVTAIDIAGSAIAFCRSAHRLPGVRFLEGDAEAIPLPDRSVDAVINVEASFCYPAIGRFLAEVERVLKPGGHFLYADLRFAGEVEALMDSLSRSGLEQLRAADITANVARALELDSDRRTRAADRMVPRPLRGVARTFTGARDSRYPAMFRSGRMRYLSFCLRKPATRVSTALTRAA